MAGIKKGIVLAGGAGNRLYPLTMVASKQLQPVYDKPMIYYTLATLMMAGIRDILVISTPDDTPRFKALLGDGHHIGINLEYAVQSEPKGIAHAFIVADDFVDAPVCLILGDNIFYGNFGLSKIMEEFDSGATIFGYQVSDPERYGVVEFDSFFKVKSLEEKPLKPKSKYAIPGLYLYDESVVDVVNAVTPSARGELEITSVNQHYLENGNLKAMPIGRGVAWLDTGTHTSLLEASHFIGSLEARQGLKIGCLEEIALRWGYIDVEQMMVIINRTPTSSYRNYLETVAMEVSG